jgi:hypothetical protein
MMELKEQFRSFADVQAATPGGPGRGDGHLDHGSSLLPGIDPTSLHQAILLGVTQRRPAQLKIGSSS